jgi:Skp family chaperone for outer membrane proteins
LFTISKAKSIPLDQIPRYSERKLQEKQKIDEEIAQADAMLQTKNVNIQAINEHLQLNEKLKEHGLSTQDIDKLPNLIENAKEYGYDSKKFVGKPI